MAVGDTVWVPVLPSLKDFGGELVKGTKDAGKKVGEQVGKDLADGIAKSSAAVDRAADVVAKAQNKAADAAGKVRVEEEKLADTRAKAQAASSQLDAAEKRLQALRDSGTATSKELESAERQVESARMRADSAATGVVAAEERLDSARRKQAETSDAATRADESLAEAKRKLTVAEEESGRAAALTADEMAKLEREQRNAEQASSDLEAIQGKLAIGFAAVVAGAGAVTGALVAVGGQFDDMYDTIRIGTGASGADMDDLAESARRVADSVPAMSGGMSEIGTVMADLNTRTGATGETLEELSAQFIWLSNMGAEADINAVTAAMTGFGVAAEDAPAALDDLFRVSQATGLSIDDLAGSVTKNGAAFREMGMGLTESAALLGNLDKAGIEGDKVVQRLTRAMGEWAAAGREPGEAMRETVGEIEQFIEVGDNAAAYDLAESLFGTRGAAQFIDAVKSGTLSMDDFVDAAGMSGDAIVELGEETADWPEQWQQFKQSAMLAVEPLATALFDRLGPALETAGEIFKNIIGWVEENKSVMLVLAGVIGTLGAALLVYKGTVAAVEMATRAWNVIQLVLNGTMKANPIGLVVTAITLLVTAVTLIATKTTWFQTIWEAVWGAVKTAASAVSDWFTGTLWPALQTAFNAIADVAMWLWQNIMVPVWSGIQAVISTWWSGVQLYWELIKTAFTTIGEVAMWLWQNIMVPVWDGITAAVDLAWSVISFIFDGWMVAFDAAGTAATWLYDNAIKPAWDGIKSAIETVWNFVSPIFDKLGGAFESLGTIATGVGDGIKTAFSGLKRIITSPLNALGTVLAKVPGSIFGFDIPGASTVKEWGVTLQNLRDGGRLPTTGPGTDVVDGILAVTTAGRPIANVDAGEWVINSRSSEKHDGLLDAINRDDPALAALPAFAGGGRVAREPYGLPVGTRITYGSPGFPEWVEEVGREFDVQASTYPGHQERDGQNKGIDWWGTVDAMQAFAEHLAGIHDQLEQVIWMNPATGQKIGVADGQLVGPGTDQPQYYANDWSGHQDHVHTRQSFSFDGMTPARNPFESDPDAAVISNIPAPVAGTSTTVSPDLPDMAVESSGSDASQPMTAEEIAGAIAGAFVTETVGDVLSIFGLDGIPLGTVEESSDGAAVVASSPSAAETVAVEVAQVAEPAPVVVADPVPPADPSAGLAGHDLYAYRIAETAKSMGLGENAAVIGEATALVEAGDPLKMWANSSVPESLQFPHDAVGNNHDSVGLFQQRPRFWGPVADLMDPATSARLFFEALTGVAGWESMDPGAAAQAVQRSAFPARYGQEMERARQVVAATGVYDAGGWLLPGQLAMNLTDTREPMAVFTDEQWSTLDDLASTRREGPLEVRQVDAQFQQIVSSLDSVPADRPDAPEPGNGRGRPTEITINVHGVSQPGDVADRVMSELGHRMGTHGGRTW